MHRYRYWVVYGIVALLITVDFIALPRLLKPHSFSERKDVYQVAATLAAGIAVLGQFIVGGLNLAATESNIELSRIIARERADIDREGQITERFTRAIEQLGSGSPAIRLGGIYALERIAKDSARDHATVVHILTAYVRERGFEAIKDEILMRNIRARLAEPTLSQERRGEIEQEERLLMFAQTSTQNDLRAIIAVGDYPLTARSECATMYAWTSTRFASSIPTSPTMMPA